MPLTYIISAVKGQQSLLKANFLTPPCARGCYNIFVITRQDLPQLRQDLVTGEWVVIASNRAQRPDSFIKKNLSSSPPAKNQKNDLEKDCIFCQILKKETPILAWSNNQELTSDQYDDWTIAVVANKYPAFILAGEARQKKIGPYQTMAATGHHELVITKNHSLTIDQLPLASVQEVFTVFQQRYRLLAQQPHSQYIAIFHNQGPEAGASVTHPHSQIIAMPTIDANIESNLMGTKRFWQKQGQCPHCLIIDDNQKNPDRVVWENKHFIIFTPFAPKSAFTLQIYPKKHQAYFDQASRQQLKGLAQAFKMALKALRRGLNNPDYNFFLNSAPCDNQNHDYYHWHWQIMPKTQIWAGFELGAGIEISTISPEDSAKYLRKQIK